LINKSIFGRRPNITFVSPRSGATIPEVERITTPVTPKQERVDTIIKKLDNVAALSQELEKAVSEKAKNVVLTLNLANPEDAVIAQAAARQFPELATDLGGFKYVDKITFSMYSHCIQELKATGFAAGTKNQATSPTFQANKTDFGGMNKDRRPDVNQASVPFAPIDIAAFVAAGIPILFGMLYPLINLAIKKDIIGHTHPVIDATSGIPTPSGPGIPLVPV
jgi:hypothetical protein